ncbi:hypothetical protein FZC83_16820 [Rossellomorea marisflavi]|uniref:Capsule polysaccharide biosynthesis protein n=1 Tax=Rossellomorea marisflavi TaxID=189381 RepID=A0A5D4RM94_9BACI|nr:hypothetical protein FZC83_16820 [Rossellomorea marisflavi]
MLYFDINGKREGQMTNYLFLRGNRNKTFFMNIAASLEERGHSCHLLKFELGELLFKNGVPSTFVPFHVNKEEYPISDDELMKLSIYNITYRERILHTKVPTKELKMYKRYMHYIDKFIDKHDVQVVCLFNGYHWIDQVTKVIAHKRGLDVIYFEDGLFRPYTITCDPKGINEMSSIPRSASFYDAIELDEKRLKKHLFTPESDHLHEKNESLLVVAFVKLLSMIGSSLHIHPNYYVHITFWQGLKYFFKKRTFSRQIEDEVELPEEYVFLPFQVSRDTQILYHSPHIKDMRDLLDHTFNAVKAINVAEGKNLHIVVKEHPEDMSRVNYDDLKERYKNEEEVLFVEKFDIHTLIEKTEAVVTINSTVGIEALAKTKRVVTLGDAFYNIEGVVHHARTPGELPETLNKSLHTKVNRGRIRKFIYYLRFHYQIEGSLQSKHKRTADKIAAHMLAMENREEHGYEIHSSYSS